MANNQTELVTPITMASLRVPQAAPKKRYSSTPITTNTRAPLQSPKVSPFVKVNRELQYDETIDCSLSMELQLGELSSSLSSNDSYRPPLNEHLDLGIVLKEWKVEDLLPVFTSKGVTLTQFSNMKEVDFLELGIFEAKKVGILKKICRFLNDQTNSY